MSSKIKIKHPVNVGGIEFDALIDSEEDYTATVPAYPTETGFSVNDTVVIGILMVKMTLYVTNTPVTWRSSHSPSNTRVNKICKQLIDMFNSKQVIKVTTADETYNNMVIDSLTISKTLEQGYAREIPISFSQVIITNTESAIVPDSYVKAGTSMETTGTAGTETATSSESSSSSSSRSSSSSSSGTSSSSSSSEQEETSQKGGSILYNIGKKTGIIK